MAAGPATRLVCCLLALLLIGATPLSGAADEPARGRGLERIKRAWERGGAAEAQRVRMPRRKRAMRGDRVQVVLEARSGVSASIDRRKLRRIGARIENRSRSFMTVSLPARHLHRLSELSQVRLARLPLPNYPLGGSGAFMSEAVTLTGADLLHAQGIDGRGVKIGVVDLEFANLAAKIASGELPPDTIGVNLSGAPDIEDGGNHGTNVAEIVADMAPGAQIYAIRIDNEASLQNAADWARDNGIDIVNHSVAWFESAYYDGTGSISSIVEQSVNVDGVFWAVAAGNFGLKHWRRVDPVIDASDWLMVTGTANRIVISVQNSPVELFLNWDQYGSSETNLDLYVYDDFGGLVASSVGGHPGATPPTEALSFPWNVNEAPYHVGIKHVSGPSAGLDVTLFSLKNNLSTPYRVSSSSFADPAAEEQAFSVSAMHKADWDDPNAGLEAFSSRGPTNDGDMKPDIVGPNRTVTSAGSPSGTSFTSPVVAGAAALFLQQDPNMTIAQLGAHLRSFAIDVNPPGYDHDTGEGQVEVGLIQAFANSDGDTILDPWDNCPYADNPGQEDVDGVAGSGADGIGDACQCGDSQGDGDVTAPDSAAIRQKFADPAAALASPELCNVIGPAGAGDCGLLDLVVIQRQIQGMEPPIQPVCEPASP